jgi:hypothetical protein
MFSRRPPPSQHEQGAGHSSLHAAIEGVARFGIGEVCRRRGCRWQGLAVHHPQRK